jgi:tetratricopeptide (TPR) repeat protein
MDFIGKKTEGNPFYLEEVVNSLIESEILNRDNSGWKLARSISEADIPSSIRGVLSARIDRLQKEAKRILQEASVIGRAFFYEILKRISNLKVPIDQYLAGLEQLDLIRVRAFEPDLEYIFKHALTQEVVYSGILKKERQEIHERIGLAIETLLKDRLIESYETLAYHFRHSRNVGKAVNYLMRSGEKNLQRYALDESHKFYEGAYKILTENLSLTNDEKRLLIDLLIKWSFVFHWRVDYSGLKTVFAIHRDLVDSLEDREIRGMYYACLGLAFGQTENSRESYELLRRAIKLCREVKNEKFTAYCYGWLTQACEELGLLDDAIVYGKKGQALARQLVWDPLLFTEVHAWMAVAYFYRGESAEIEKIANAFLEKGNENSDPGLISQGYMFMGMMSQAAGDYTRSIKEIEKAILLTKDTIVLYHSKLMLGISCLLFGRFQEAEDNLNAILLMTQHIESWVRKPISEIFLNAALAARGDLSRSIKNLHRLQSHFLENGQKVSFVFGEYILGKIYFQMIQNKAPKDFRVITKNIGFLIKTIPFAAKKAEYHYQSAIQTAEETGAKGVLGQSCLDLGLLYKIKKRNDEARKYISKAVKIFEECGAYAFLEQARGSFESLS